MQRAAINGIPDDVRAWLEARLIKEGFAGYSEIAAELNAELAKRGLELTISRTALHRFGKTVEGRIDDLRRTTQLAKTLAAEVEDDAGAVSDALMRLVQDKVFNLLLDTTGELETKDLAKIGHVIADLGRATILQKKWQTTVRERAAKVADAVAANVKAAGLTPEAADAIRRDILGIAA